ncbi:MAG TPA: GTP-binding protein, partial [Bacillota bacterium]|nr:GTP-binding protein [Bacillota bacterium]
MKDYKTENLRNVGLFGHGSSGKTTMAEAMLFNTGVLDRFGKVEDGNTVTDYDPEEIKRKISISAAMAPCEWKEKRINIIDTPGYFDFVGETVASLKVADGAIIAVDSTGGVEVGAEKAWDLVSEGKKSCMFFVNKLDRENTSFSKVVEQLREAFGNKVVPFALPIGSEANFKGLVDIIDMKAKIREGNKTVVEDIPANLKAEAEEYRNVIIEAAAQTDEELMEKYFNGEELSREEIVKGLRLGVVSRDVVPVICGSAAKNIGVDLLMDAVLDYLPSPVDAEVPEAVNVKSKEKIKVAADRNAPFSAQVYKTIADPFVGKISMFRVMSGEMKADMEVLNPNKEKKEKLSSLFLLRGKKQVAADKLIAGDIGAVAKLQYTTTGDTLCDANKLVMFEPATFPEPSISMAIEPKSKGDEDKIGSGLQRLVEEDPT